MERERHMSIVTMRANLTDSDIRSLIKGPSEDAIDFWIGYERKLTDRIDWRIQLNVRNAFGSDNLIPVTWNPDNTAGTYRIPEPTTWSLGCSLSAG